MRKFIGFLVLSLAVTAFSMACDENGKCTHTDKAACMAAMKAAAEKGCDHAKAVTADVTASSAETKACCASEKATKASCSGEAAKASCSSKAAAAAASCEKSHAAAASTCSKSAGSDVKASADASATKKSCCASKLANTESKPEATDETKPNS
ncbi:MAG: hypothetical protein KDC35_12825 [Acidobacteria bacterium]|nr:hypothetical protein [Acidobacteriota bacterium]